MNRLLIIAATLVILSATHSALAVTDGIYGLTATTPAWYDGTDGSLLTTPDADYDFVYGDEASLTYTIPASWSSFTFYGQTYTQITVDTNGTIWFGSPDQSFSLYDSAMKSVISVWHNDLSSYGNGGVFIRHKTDPERLVIEWQTETYTDEGGALSNNFEAVLYPTGIIRFDYTPFAAANVADFGSGISNRDGVHYLSVTGNFQPVYQLGTSSFTFGIIGHSALQVNFSGTGNGIITSTPPGIACNTVCAASFPTGEPITLHAAADQYSLFNGWTAGPCTGGGDCLLTLDTDMATTAEFTRDAAHQVYVPGDTPQYFSSIQTAYDNALTGTAIRIWAVDYTESVTCNRLVDVILDGGYDSGYVNRVGTTVINGALIITDGRVTASGIAVR